MHHTPSISSSKLPNVGTNIFTTMGRLANEHGAVNIAQGFPNFEPDPVLIDLVSEAMNKGYNQYAPMAGDFGLREVIAQKMEQLYGRYYHPEHEVTITIGATQAIYSIIGAFVRPGDEVIVFKPAYDCYEPAIEINGGVPVLIPLQGLTYTIDWKEFKGKLSSKTKMVIINTPHNPSGTLLSKEDMLQLQQLLKGTDIILISDEVYEHIVFDGKSHESAAKYPDLAARSFICASFGKTFHITGWRTGYCVAPEALMYEFRKSHQFNVFSANHPIQVALATYMKNPKTYLELSSFFEQKRNFFLNAIAGSRFKAIPSQGTYFQLLDYSAITDENDLTLAKRLVREYGIASIPISVFNINEENKTHQLRFCFAKTAETLEKAAEILLKI
ncbi:methionine aminotransferase [Spongiimicrobium salis]|uniref:methionine aminotransferase n=1 Tax=Spongiimicrobium salis TaxID=1667022 RepID=UPI00374DAA40